VRVPKVLLPPISDLGDHRLSWEVGHLLEVVLTNGHAVTQKDAWVEHVKHRARKFEAKAEEIEARADEEFAIR